VSGWWHAAAIWFAVIVAASFVGIWLRYVLLG